MAWELSFGECYLQVFREDGRGALLQFAEPVFPRAQQPRAKLCSSAAEEAEKRGQRQTFVGSGTPTQRETRAEPWV